MRNYQENLEAASSAAAYFNGSLTASLAIAWYRKEYHWVRHFIAILENACKEAGKEWQFYKRSMAEVSQYKAMLETIKQDGNNYFKNTESHTEGARRAADVLLGGMEGIRQMAWYDNEYKTCRRINNIIERALNEAGPDWFFYDRAMQECAEFTKKLNDQNGN